MKIESQIELNEARKVLELKKAEQLKKHEEEMRGYKNLEQAQKEEE